jgi:hypothetical protein
MREKQSKRERVTLCNVLSTNHRKFGEQFPSIFIPKLYRANKKGTNPKTQRERAKRAVQNGSNSRMILQEKKSLCFFARRKPCEILQKRNSLSSAVAGR